MKTNLILLVAVMIASCSYKPEQKRLSEFQDHEAKILASLYKLQNDTLQFLRALDSGGEAKLKFGKIWMGDYALLHQVFDSTIITDKKEIYEFVNNYKQVGFSNQLSDERDVMFIQIVPDSTMTSLQAFGFLNYRQEVEEIIDEAFIKNRCGEWFAGDMGAGGNMLFFIDDWELAIQTVIEELKKENLLDHVLIARRHNTDADDWTYEVVFPVEFEGVFNPI
jgi:hypothetical protein